MQTVYDKTDGCIGIDLGTTNCVVSYVDKNGDVQIIPNLDGGLTTPTFIYLGVQDNAKIKTIVGQKAKELAKVEPDNVLSSFKTLMGTSTVIKEINENKITSLTASYLMLRYLKKTAEVYLDKNVSGAVISVPAYFTEPQVQATKIAAKKAGLDVKRILIEPTAGAFYYGVNPEAGTKDGKIVAVYDLGGGTFDISIISLIDDTSTVIGPPKGDNKLGGDDIDREIANYVLKENNKKKLTPDDFTKLIRTCELAKIELCDNINTGKEPEVTISADQLNLKPVVLDKATFESLIDPLVERTIICFQAALDDAGVTSADLDEVVLVGGSSRIPYIRERLVKFLNNPRFNRSYFNAYSVDPDLAVGLGCGILLKYIAENKEKNITDIVSKTIGIEDEYGNMEPIIRKGKTLPAKASRVFTNARDNQTSVEIKVYEGEEKLASRNTFLSKVTIAIEKAPKNKQQILVYAGLTKDGVLSVDVLSGATSGGLRIERQFDDNEDVSWIESEIPSKKSRVKEFV